MKNRIKNFLSIKRNLFIIYALFSIILSFESYQKGPEYNAHGEITFYGKYNNYIIFEQSFCHLKNNQDLYILHPEDHWDLYKYTPTFSAFFGVFAIFPDWIGLNLWNLLNALVLLLSVYYLPKLNNYQKGLVLIILMLELSITIMNEQSNALIAGLLVFSFGFMEKNKPIWASLFIVVSAFIKLFGIVGFAIFLLYPKKWKLAVYSLGWTVVLFLVPLVFVSFEQYMFLIGSYFKMLGADHSASYGFSVMGWLNTWFCIDIDKYMLVLLGVLLFMIPYYRIKFYGNHLFRYLTMTSILIWIVIFNHKAESPTFIIAMAGVALWFIKSPKNTLNIMLFVCAMVCTSLSPTDIFPSFIRDEFFTPYAIKAVPCILIWGKIIYDMVVLDFGKLNAQAT